MGLASGNLNLDLGKASGLGIAQPNTLRRLESHSGTEKST
jgi:hypothetical protein